MLALQMKRMTLIGTILSHETLEPRGHEGDGSSLDLIRFVVNLSIEAKLQVQESTKLLGQNVVITETS